MTLHQVSNVAELIAALQTLPPKAAVWHIWDGAARTHIRFVWVAPDGIVMTADQDQDVYRDIERPVSAPTTRENRYWRTPEIDEDQS